MNEEDTLFATNPDLNFACFISAVSGFDYPQPDDNEIK